MLLNRLKRTQLARRALREITAAARAVLASMLSDLVAYGVMTYSGHVPDRGAPAEETDRLIAELRELGWTTRSNASWR